MEIKEKIRLLLVQKHTADLLATRLREVSENSLAATAEYQSSLSSGPAAFGFQENEAKLILYNGSVYVFRCEDGKMMEPEEATNVVLIC